MAFFDPFLSQAKRQLKLEGLENDPRVTSPESEWFGKPLEYALSIFTFYKCEKCGVLIYGGHRECGPADGGAGAGAGVEAGAGVGAEAEAGANAEEEAKVEVAIDPNVPAPPPLPPPLIPPHRRRAILLMRGIVEEEREEGQERGAEVGVALVWILA